MNFVTGLLYLLAVNRLFYAHGRQKQGWGLQTKEDLNTGLTGKYLI
jgi:hypothetical protein